MVTEQRARPLVVIASLAAAVLIGCGASGTGSISQRPATGTAPGAERRASFADPTNVNNRMFPLLPGTQYVYRGKIVEGGVSKPHSVVFTVTDLTKMVGSTATVVVWDRDLLEGRLQEQELALFAQDDQGNVWNFGEYPEEYENGKFSGAPSTWVKGAHGAYGGVHVPARPALGTQYVEGRVPTIKFYDISRVVRAGLATCTGAGCFRNVLVVDEWSPGDPSGGHQVKYYAPGTGLVRVGAHGGDSQEFLSLVAVRHLGTPAMAQVRAAVLRMDRRAYRVSQVYQATRPATPSHG